MYDSEITIDIFGTSVIPVRRSRIAMEDLGIRFNVEQTDRIPTEIVCDDEILPILEIVSQIQYAEGTPH